MKFNTEKCEVIHLAERQYRLHSKERAGTEGAGYTSLYILESGRAYREEVVKKAYGILGFIKRCSDYNSMEVVLNLYS